MSESVFLSAQQRDQFADDVLENLGYEYMDSKGQLFQGQALSHLQAALRGAYRGRKWKLGGGYWGFQQALQEAGFKVVRARTMRTTRNGLRKPYQECDVVTL
jgi:hypothetical protein